MLITARTVKLTTRTEIEVRRTLPHVKRKIIGPWCFIDHLGPSQRTNSMKVAAHAHIGPQRDTCLFSAEIGIAAARSRIFGSGQLNLMKAGNGISHSEKSDANGNILHSMQLWLGLPRDRQITAGHFKDDLGAWIPAPKMPNPILQPR